MSIVHFQSTVIGEPGAAPPGPTYTLSGSTGTPNDVTNTESSPTNSSAWWEFRTNGTVWSKGDSGTVQFQDSIEWTDEQDTPTVDIWIRSTANAGAAHTTGPTNGIWNVLQGSGEANQRWTWTETTDGEATTQGSVKIEIATDSGGSNIVATGYYQGTAIVEI